MTKPGEPLIPQCPTRKVGNTTYISVPGPVPVIKARKRMYKARLIDGPQKGQLIELEVLFAKVTRFTGAGKVSYYRLDDPKQRLKEYRYSIKP